MVGSVSAANKVLIGPSVKVRVFPADEAVAGESDLALALVHGVAEVTEVDTLGMPVATVGFVLAGIFWLTHLRTTNIQTMQHIWYFFFLSANWLFLQYVLLQ